MRPAQGNRGNEIIIKEQDADSREHERIRFFDWFNPLLSASKYLIWFFFAWFALQSPAPAGGGST
jgi:hypothetical protein